MMYEKGGEIPVDRTREFRESDYPRKPSLYTPSVHFGQIVRRKRRFWSGEIIDSCIEDGDLRENGDGLACFRKVWGEGVAYYLLVGFHHDGYRIVVTGWPHLHDREAALDSDLWSSRELDRIEELNEDDDKKGSPRFTKPNNWIENSTA